MKGLSEKSGSYDGKISVCPYQNCGFRCCKFNQDNYIVMYPGEVEEAVAAGKSLSHLQLTPYHGGHKAICKAKNTASCDDGYKPLDCRCYPFFPKIAKEKLSLLSVIKGGKCPLQKRHLFEHKNWVKRLWRNLKKRNSKVIEWLEKVRLIGYVDYHD